VASSSSARAIGSTVPAIRDASLLARTGTEAGALEGFADTVNNLFLGGVRSVGLSRSADVLLRPAL
jgi:hypothetical protein